MPLGAHLRCGSETLDSISWVMGGIALGNDHYSEVQSVALMALGDIGPEARETIATLERIARDPNPNVARQASEALAKIRK